MIRKVNLLENLDWLTVGLFLLMVLLGWINIYAAVYDEEHKSILSFSQRYGKQLIWMSAAALLALFAFLLDSKFYINFSYLFYGLTLLLLMAVLVVGTEINGAKSWILLGGIQLQPTEFAKVGTCLALARWLSTENRKLMEWRSLSVCGAIILFPMLLIMLQPDTGSALVYLSFSLMFYREGLPGSILFFGFLVGLLFVLSLMMDKTVLFLIMIGLGFLYALFLSLRIRELITGFLIFGLLLALSHLLFSYFFAQLDFSYTLAAAALLSGVVFWLWSFLHHIPRLSTLVWIVAAAILFCLSVDFFFESVLEPHHQQRVKILLGMESDPLGYGYNVNQSKIAIGSGGWFGKGFLQGTQTKYNFVPEQSTDFIFCTVGEEWGWFGSVVVVGLFLLLLLRILHLAERQRSSFSRIYAYCVASILFFHVLINVGMALALLPVIGIPLPFFSYGGSSLWTFTLLLFILLRLDASRMEFLR
ncbi:MAG: rod shape-determining protein RodA [Bacteroidales bacterium]